MKYTMTKETKQLIFDTANALYGEDKTEFYELTYKVYLDESFVLQQRNLSQMTKAEKLFFVSGLYKTLKENRNKVNRYNRFHDK